MANDGTLKKATNGWTAPVVVRTYDGKHAAKEFEQEARTFALRGYEPEAQTEDGGHVHVGRLLLTGGFSIFAGRAGIRSKGNTTVTFKRMRGPRVDVVVDEVKRGFLAGPASKVALSQVSDVRAMDVELPVRILEGVPEAQAEVVVAHLAQHAVRARIQQIEGSDAPTERSDVAAQLERLSALHLSGVLTDDEFATAKARALAEDDA